MKDKILSFLPKEHPWQNSVLYFDSIDSTNSHAKVLAQAGAPHGTVLIADHQTGGRGRMGRSFSSPAGSGIYMTVILRPDCLPEALMHLTCATAVAVCDATEDAAGFRPGIKWTNDLVSGGKKLGGILTELSIDFATGKVQYAIIGVGINCSQQTPDFPPEIRDMAASLTMVTGKPVDRAKMAAAMILRLSQMSDILLTDKAGLMASYEKDCITVGQEIVLLRGEERSYGKAIGIDSEGGLIVVFRDGTTKTVTSGEVSVRGMYGYV